MIGWDLCIMNFEAKFSQFCINFFLTTDIFGLWYIFIEYNLQYSAIIQSIISFKTITIRRNFSIGVFSQFFFSSTTELCSTPPQIPIKSHSILFVYTIMLHTNMFFEYSIGIFSLNTDRIIHLGMYHCNELSSLSRIILVELNKTLFWDKHIRYFGKYLSASLLT